MIIDCHGHISAPAALYAYKATLLANRGAHGRGKLEISDEDIHAALYKPQMGEHGHMTYLDHVHTNRQLISPRPFQLMHSETPGKLVHWFTEESNNIVHRQCTLYPDRFFGVCALPQVAGRPIEEALPELDRCINKLGFKGCLINPDPFENNGNEAPPMGDRYWYPLYEKLCEYNVPGHIHATASRSERVTYSVHFINEESIAVLSLAYSKVFEDFPQLKIVVSHGGGAIPYQLGRFDARSLRQGGPRLRDRLRNLYFDTVLYTQDAIELLIKTVGPDRCLFGAECPGTGSVHNPDTNRSHDDVKPYIDNIEFLSDAERKMIYETNATGVFNLA